MPIMRRVGRPGLLGIAARTAVVAGTATAVSGAVAQRQRIRAAEHQAQEQQQIQEQRKSAYERPSVPQVAVSASPGPAAPGSEIDVVAKLQQLGELHQQGLLSAEEFARAKKQLLGS